MRQHVAGHRRPAPRRGSRDDHPCPTSDDVAARAEQLLLTLLEVIGELKSVGDITPEELGRISGLEVKFDGEDRYGAGDVLNQEWSYVWEIDQKAMRGPRLEFSFRQRDPRANPPMTGLCQLDLKRFASEMERLDFDRETIYGSHGSLIGHRFYRVPMTATVLTRGEASSSSELIKHECVQMVVVQ